jgi:hypothetical protein
VRETTHDYVITGTAKIYEGYDASNAYYDFGIIVLDQPASSLIQISPIPASVTLPSIGTTHTLVGFGKYGTSGCDNAADGLRRYVHMDLAAYNSNDEGLTFTDANEGSCVGDSGGPAIANGIVQGIASSVAGSHSKYDAVESVATWLSDEACPVVSIDYPQPSFCNAANCECQKGEGDCDSNSECAAGASCVSNIGAAGGLPSGYDLCWADSELLTVYAGANFGGASQRNPIGEWRAADLWSVGNNAISSMSIPDRMRVATFSNSDCTGTRFFYDGQVSSMPGNDDIASCVVAYPAVTVFSGVNYAGTKESFHISVNHNQFSTIPNNSISSLKIAPGLIVRACTLSGSPGTVGTGDCVTYTSDTASISGVMNDSISNIEITPGVALYKDPNFSGAMSTTATNFIAADNSIDIDEMSMIVSPGLMITMCTSVVNDIDNVCRDFTGTVSQLPTDIAGRVSRYFISSIDLTPE